MNNGRFIVKVQRPLASNDANPGALVYDEACSVYLFVDLSPDILSLLGDELKVYAWAELAEGGRLLRILEAAPAQAW